MVEPMKMTALLTIIENIFCPLFCWVLVLVLVLCCMQESHIWGRWWLNCCCCLGWLRMWSGFRFSFLRFVVVDSLCTILETRTLFFLCSYFSFPFLEFVFDCRTCALCDFSLFSFSSQPLLASDQQSKRSEAQHCYCALLVHGTHCTHIVVQLYTHSLYRKVRN